MLKVGSPFHTMISVRILDLSDIRVGFITFVLHTCRKRRIRLWKRHACTTKDDSDELIDFILNFLFYKYLEGFSSLFTCFNFIFKVTLKVSLMSTVSETIKLFFSVLLKFKSTRSLCGIILLRQGTTLAREMSSLEIK